MGLPYNRAIKADLGEGEEVVDIIAGTAFICDCSGEDFASLNAEQLKKYAEEFKFPEHFYRTRNGIEAVPYNPPKLKDQER